MVEYEAIRKGLFGNGALPDSSDRSFGDSGYNSIEAQKLWLENRYGLQFAYRVQSTAIELRTDGARKPVLVHGEVSPEQKRQGDALLMEIAGAGKTPDKFRISI
jgi:hypothetical protein